MALREINERQSDNCRVTLYWDDATNTMTVEAEDLKEPANDRTITGIPTADAGQAFQHPWTYSKGKVAA